MTKRFVILAALVLLATPLFAQKTAISVFTSNVAYEWTHHGGSSYSADYGVGAEYWFTPRVSAAVNASRHSDEVLVANRFSHVYEYPVDALLRYRFSGNDRWKPYLGGGVRGVRGFDFPFGGRSWSLAPEFNGGVTFLITKKLGLDLDGKVVVNQTRYTGVDDRRVSVGLSWRF